MFKKRLKQTKVEKKNHDRKLSKLVNTIRWKKKEIEKGTKTDNKDRESKRRAEMTLVQLIIEDNDLFSIQMYCEKLC